MGITIVYEEVCAGRNQRMIETDPRVSTFMSDLKKAEHHLGNRSLWAREAMIGTYFFLSAGTGLRALLFKTLLQLSTVFTLEGLLFQTVVKLCKGCELTSIYLIDSMLYQRLPEVLHLKELAGEQDRIMDVWSFMISVPESERSYVCLLRPDKIARCWNVLDSSIIMQQP